ncbi:DUF1579 domain-containing protein [Filimonas effusa]|uniref:DUF1579 domain-containing protein n=2 Tax=Filimonas effusa TaxID=2508721 RepID=A0A4Q1DFE5_9BACT|nr:DUF1579 domain-containing protein [Filimonas effusa]
MAVFCTAAITLIACNSSTNSNTTTSDSSAPAAATATKPPATEEKWEPVDSATEMKAWQEYATPGASHEALAKSNGSWNGEVTMWHSADGAPMSSKATITNKMILGGRYQQSNFSGNFMGMPFEGMSIVGYDNYLKKFISTWVDNMGTGIMKMEGPWDESSKSMTLTGSSINPANGKECKMREVYKIVDAKTEIMEMYGPDSKTGKEYKMMEIKFTRK